MQYNKERLVSALALNQPVKEDVEDKLNKEIASANQAILAKKMPTNLEQISKLKEELEPLSEWCTVYETLIKECEKLKVSELTDDQTKAALCRQRSFTKWGTKTARDTQKLEKSSKQEPIDIPSVLARLGVDVEEFNKHLSSVILSVALSADAKLESGKSADILAVFRGDEVIKEKLLAGADFTSNRTMKSAIQNTVNAFLPSADFKAFNKDAEFIYAATTKIDKKNPLSICTEKRSKFKEVFFDYIQGLLIGNGVVRYNVTMNAGKDKTRSYDNIKEPEQVEEPAPAAPAEKPEEKSAAKREKKPAAKKAADKPATKKTKKTDAPAA